MSPTKILFSYLAPRIKIVMTGSASDPKEWQEHIRNRSRRKMIDDNFKDLRHALKLIIVREMFLTGYDVPVDPSKGLWVTFD